MLRLGEARQSTLEGYACREIFAQAQALAQVAKLGVWGVQAAAAQPSLVATPTLPPATQVAILPATLTPSITPPSPASVTTTPLASVTPTATQVVFQTIQVPTNTLPPGVTPTITLTPTHPHANRDPAPEYTHLHGDAFGHRFFGCRCRNCQYLYLRNDFKKRS